MKIIYLIPCLLIILSVACSREDNEDIDSSIATKAVTFAGGMDNVNVLVFKQSGSDYLYQQVVNSGWSAEGKTTVNLKQGSYKFLSYKSAEQNTDRQPGLLIATTSFGDIQWNARADEASGNGYLFPVDEMWLPETYAMAYDPYTINSATTVTNTLTRAVSQVVVHIRKGSSTGAQPIDPSEGTNQNLGQMTLNITEVGEAVNIQGGIGAGSTKVNINQSLTDNDEFASFEGPFVFPSGSGNDATVTINYKPEEGSAFPPIATSVPGQLQRNHKLEITLWVGNEEPGPEENLQITVDVVEMEDNTGGGDNGIWE